MRILRALSLAFVSGAMFALIGQVVLAFWSMLLTPVGDAFLSSLTVPLTLVSMSLIGGLLYLSRIYDWIEKTCGFGAILPFCGFCIAIAHQVENARVQGASVGAAIMAGLKMVGSVVGVGVVGCFLIGVATLVASAFLAPVSALTAAVTSAQASVPVAAPASIELLLGALVVGGALSAVFQAFMLFTELPVPKILILGLFASGLLTPLGLMGSLSSLGGAGADIMITGLGSAASGTSMALLGGNPLPFLVVACVTAIVTILGSIWGLLRAK